MINGWKRKSQETLQNIWNKWKGKHNKTNPWDAAKILLKRKFISLNAYIKQEGFQIDNLIFPLKKLEEIRKQIKVRAMKREEMIAPSGNE